MLIYGHRLDAARRRLRPRLLSLLLVRPIYICMLLFILMAMHMDMHMAQRTHRQAVRRMDRPLELHMARRRERRRGREEAMRTTSCAQRRSRVKAKREASRRGGGRESPKINKLHRRPWTSFSNAFRSTWPLERRKTARFLIGACIAFS